MTKTNEHDPDQDTRNANALDSRSALDLLHESLAALAHRHPAGRVHAPEPTACNVTVTTDLVTGDFGLTGTLSIADLAYNSAATGFARLDWSTAFDLDADGTPDILDPGAALPTPADLAIDLPGTLEFRVSGGITGNASAPAGFAYPIPFPGRVWPRGRHGTGRSRQSPPCRRQIYGRRPAA